MVGASQNLVSLVPNSGNFRFRDDSDGSGGSELVEVTKSGELIEVISGATTRVARSANPGS